MLAVNVTGTTEHHEDQPMTEDWELLNRPFIARSRRYIA